MNIGRMYTPKKFIPRCIDHSTRGIGGRNEYWKGVNPPTFIARGMNPLIGGIGARDEYWTGVHPTNIQRW